MASTEVRLERLRPAEIDAALERAPVAWIPLGALEYHADHLPNGTDGLTAHAVVTAAAERLGGVVLPWSYLTFGTLALPWSFRYEPALVAEALRQTLRQLPAHGVRLAVVHTGHGPLDLDHLIKRVCTEVEAEGIGLRAMGLCYLELNAVLGTGLGTDWPVAVDHGATMETSWVAGIEPSLVDVARLPDDPSATIVGVYGPNPRFTVDPARGAAQVAAAGALLAERAKAVLDGAAVDPLTDLRTFVERYWPEPLELSGRAGAPSPVDRAAATGAGTAAILVTNPAPVSRYLSGLSLTIDGTAVASDGISLRNPTPGEVGVAIAADALGPERGFYVRRLQTAEIGLPMAVGPGLHQVRLDLELAGVTTTTFAETVDFR